MHYNNAIYWWPTWSVGIKKHALQVLLITSGNHADNFRFSYMPTQVCKCEQISLEKSDLPRLLLTYFTTKKVDKWIQIDMHKKKRMKLYGKNQFNTLAIAKALSKLTANKEVYLPPEKDTITITKHIVYYLCLLNSCWYLIRYVQAMC